jgi:hypothetical protein
MYLETGLCIIKEIKETSDLSLQEQFSIEVLNQAAKTFQRLSIERGNGYNDTIYVNIKSASYNGAYTYW